MQTPKISNCSQNCNSQMNYNLNQYQAPKTNLLKQDSVSFGNTTTPNKSLLKTIQKAMNSSLKFIGAKGFFVEFLIVDSISLIAPRILVGLNRDKDKTGHYNIKAAKEEAGREILSGPSMNLIPMGILAAVSALKPASKIDRKVLEGLTTHSRNILEETKAQPITDRKVFHQQLADKIFDDNFKGKLAEGNRISEDRMKEIFRKALVKAVDNKADTKAQDKFGRIVGLMTDKLAQAPVSKGSLKIGEEASSAAGLAQDIKRYSTDILEKVINQKGDIEKLVNRSHVIKTGTAISAFVAVGSFLLYLPKLYQQKGLSPAQESAKRAEEARQKELQANQGGA